MTQRRDIYLNTPGPVYTDSSNIRPSVSTVTDPDTNS